MLILPTESGAEPSCANCKHSALKRSPANALEMIRECHEGPPLVVLVPFDNGPQLMPALPPCPPGYKCSRYVGTGSSENPS